MSEEIQYRAILRDVAQVVIGELVSEDEDKVVLKNPSILHVQAQGQSISLQYIPLGLVSMNPPITLKVLCKEGADLDFGIPFSKHEVLVADVPLNDEVLNGYKEAQNPSPIATPSGAGALVGPDGSVLPTTTPKAQNLF
jgi:hypothetical protein|tara:strand:- start:313 stop:729 length:417 start_codon:yes stop_codon:yes gene_type:complete